MRSKTIMKLKENSRLIYDYVLEHEDEDITAKDIAEATGLTSRQVNGSITMAFVRHRDENKNEVPLMERVEAEVEEADGTHSKVKLIRLTDAGRNIEIEDAE